MNRSTTVSARNFRPSIRLSWTKSMHQRSLGRVGVLGTTRRWLPRFFRFFVRTPRSSSL